MGGSWSVGGELLSSLNVHLPRHKVSDERVWACRPTSVLCLVNGLVMSLVKELVLHAIGLATGHLPQDSSLASRCWEPIPVRECRLL